MQDKDKNNVNPSKGTPPKSSINGITFGEDLLKDNAETPTDDINKSDDLFSNVGDFIKSPIESGGERNLGIDLEEYSKYVGGNLGYVVDKETADLYRAKAQSNWAQLGNAMGRVAGNIVPEIISQASNILDLEDYHNSNEEVGNWLGDLMQDSQEWVNKQLPIYRENPNKSLDVGDPGWWFENGANLVKSAGAFAALGYATGGASLTLLTRANNAVRWLRGAEGIKAGLSAQNRVKAGAGIMNAALLNQAEGIGVAVETYDTAYKEKLQELQGDASKVNLSPKEIDDLAKQYASKRASSALNFNRLNIALNLTSASAFIRTPLMTRLKNTRGGFSTTGKRIGGETVQEAIEEEINLISKEQALKEGYTFKDALATATSDEGLESAFLGAIGGGLQTGLTEAGTYIPMHENTAYKEAYASEYRRLKKQVTLSEKERQAKAREFAYEKAGTDKKKVSEQFLRKQEYLNRQEVLDGWKEKSKAEKISDVTAVFNNAQKTSELYRQLDAAPTEEEKERIAEQLLYQQATNAFHTGTTEGLLEMYKDYEKLEEEEAQRRGIFNGEDVSSPEYYKNRARKAIETIETLENEYNNSFRYVNSTDVYNNRVNHFEHIKETEELEKGIRDIVTKVESSYKNADVLQPSRILDGNNIDLRKAKKAFRETPEYQEIKELKAVRDSFRVGINKLQEEYQTITKRDYQLKLKERIDKLTKDRKKKEDDEQKKERKKKRKEQVRKTVNKFKKSSREEDTKVKPEEPDTTKDTVEDTEEEDEKELIVDASEDTPPPQPKPTSSNRLQISKLQEDGGGMSAAINPNIEALEQEINSNSLTPKQKIDRINQFKSILAENSKKFPVLQNVSTVINKDLDNAIEVLQQELNNSTETNENLKKQQRDIINSILSGEEDEDLSPAEEEGGLSKERDQVNKMFNLLEFMQKNGIDTTDFKTVVLSFREAVKEEDLIKAYDRLRALYEVISGTRINDTYAELIYNKKKKKTIAEQEEEIISESLPDEVYTNEKDTISKDHLNLVRDIAEENGIDVKGKIFLFNTDNKARNVRGHDKLAYLARNYKRVFGSGETQEGIQYISVNNKDVDDIVRDIDPLILDPDALVEGTTISFVPLKELTLEDGTIVTDEDGVEAAPIGVMINNKLIDGLYLHVPNWITRETVPASETLLEKDREQLRRIRKKVLEKGRKDVTIKSRTPGHLISSSTNEYRTLTENLPNVTVGIVKDGVIRISKDSIAPVNNKYPIANGKNVVVIPFGKGKKAIPIKRLPVKDEYRESIVKAVEIYLRGEETNEVKVLDSEYGLNILRFNDLKKYIKKFIYTYDNFDGSANDFKDHLKDLKDNVHLVRMTNNGIEFGSGQGLNFNLISKNTLKNTDKSINTALSKLRKHLSKVYINVDINNLQEEFILPLLKDGAVEVAYDNYEEFIKDNLISNFKSIQLENGKDIYTIQGTIQYTTDTPSKEIKEDTNTVNPEDGGTDSDSPIFLPNGEQFNPEELDEDFAPSEELTTGKEETGVEYVTQLVKGVSVNIQNSLIQTIAADLYNRAVQGEEVKVEDAVNTWLDFVNDSIKPIHEKKNTEKAKKYVEQINKLVNNKVTITNRVSKLLKQTEALRVEEDLDYIEATGLEDSGSVLEKTQFTDKSIYTIDPRTTLSPKIKNFLSFVPDMKVVKKDGKKVIKPKRTFLGTTRVIPYDSVFKTISTLLSNNNDQYIKPDIDTYISILEDNYNSKPYLRTVVENLKNADTDIKNSFVTAFSKHYTHHMFLTIEYDRAIKGYKVRPSFSDNRNLSNMIIDEWQHNLITGRYIDIGEEEVTLKKELLNQFNLYFEDVKRGKRIPNATDLDTWLRLIGVTVPKELLEDYENYGINRGATTQDLDEAFTSTTGVFKFIHAKVNKVKDLEKEDLFSDKVFKFLAIESSQYRDDLYTNSHKDVRGNTIFSYSFNKYAIDRIGKLKTSNSLVNNLSKDPFAKTSLWLDRLTTTENGVTTINRNSRFFQHFKYSTVDGFKITGKKGKALESLKPKELELTKLGFYMNRGNTVKGEHKIRSFYPTMSDKDNMILIEHLAKTFTLDRNGTPRKQDIETLYNILIKPEILRIRQFQELSDKDKKKFTKEYTKGAGKFLLFPELNNIEELWEDGELKDIFTDADLEIEAKLALLRTISDEMIRKKAKWQEYGFIKTNKDTGRDELTILDADYKKQSKFKDQTEKEFRFNYIVNSMIANMNIQQLFLGDPATYYKAKSNLPMNQALETNDNQGKRLAGDNAPAKDIQAEEGETFKLLILKDKEVGNKSLVYDWYERLLGKERAEDYLNINGTDAQEFTTLKEHLRVMRKVGDISTETEERLLTFYENTGTLPEEDKEFILQPMKPKYVNNYPMNGIMNKMYIKSSSVPLLKEMTKGTPLDKLREVMESKDIDRAAFESAVKLGQPNELLNIWDGDDIKIDNDKINVLQVPREGHGIQQDLPYDPKKDKVNDGTQQSMLLFNNLMEVDGFENPLEDGKVKGRDLYNLYNNTYRRLFYDKYRKLTEELSFNPKTGEVDLGALEKLIIEEANSRNYDTNSILSLALNDIKTKFEIPLWLSGNEAKISSLLNSVVDNRIRKRKHKGKSFVLMTEEGLSNPDIIRDPNWDGVLKPMREEEKISIDKETGKEVKTKTGNILPAEVIIPFYFWDNKGNKLKMSDYIKDGVLDTDKLDPRLLESFGFRIPTQGLNSMAYIKVVGFLPDYYRDTIIAPRDFVTQMGSDFDVDKLYTNMYNSAYNKATGKILKVTSTLVNNTNKLKEQREALAEEYKTANKTRKNEIQIEQGNIKFNVYEFTNKPIEEQLNENLLLDIHRSVLLNPAEEVQQQRANPLLFGELPNLVKKLGRERIGKSWTPLSEDYQSTKYLNARAGKAGVGSFSLDSVFNAVLQQADKPIYFQTIKKTGKEETVVPYRLEIAGAISNSLNSPYSTLPINETSETIPYKSDVISAFQSAAVDNENEQMMDKLNINNYTFDAIRFLAQVGFKEDIIVALINQPSVVKYIENKKIGKENEIPDYKKGYNKLVAKTSKEEMFRYIKNPEAAPKSYQDAILLKFLEATSKGETLKQIQSTINSDSSGVGKDLFYSLIKGDQIVNLPMTANIANLESIIGDYVAIGSDPDYIEARELDKTSQYFKEKEEQGYFRYKGVLIKPKTIKGYASVYATLFNNKVWRNHLPYENPYIFGTFNSLLRLMTDTPKTINDKAAMHKQLFSAYKSYLFSFNAMALSGEENLQKLRNKILYDTEEKQSLGSYIYEIRNNNDISNTLINKLLIGQNNKQVDLEGKVPTNILYNSASSETLDEEIIRESLIEMLMSNEPLPKWNDEEMTHKDLAIYLIIQQTLTGGVQKANQFVKHIPVEYLKSEKYYDNIQSILNGEMVKLVINGEEVDLNPATISEGFITQYIQHNPRMFYVDPEEDQIDRSEEELKKALNNKDLNVYYKIEESSGGKGYKVFIHNMYLNRYEEIDTLGDGDHLEYDISKVVGKTNIYINEAAQATEESEKETQEAREEANTVEVEAEEVVETPQAQLSEVILPNEEEIETFMSLDRRERTDDEIIIKEMEGESLEEKYLLNNLDVDNSKKYFYILEKLEEEGNTEIERYFAGKLKDITDTLGNVPIITEPNLASKGRTVTSKITGEALRIEINPNKIKSEKDMKKVLLEEITHAIFKKDTLTLDSEEARALNDLYLEVKEEILDQYGEEFKAMTDKLKSRSPLTTQLEVNVLYPVYNLQEFIAASIKNEGFQRHLTKKNRTTFQKVINFFHDILVRLGVKEDSYLEEVLYNIISSLDKKSIKGLNKDAKKTRSIGWISQKLNIVDEQGNPKEIRNPNEVADFINNKFDTVVATVDGNYVNLSYDTDALSEDLAADDTMGASMGPKIASYLSALQLRLKRNNKALAKAKAEKNQERIEEIQDRIDKDKKKLEEAKHIPSLVDLYHVGLEDLQEVKEILDRDISTSDILYMRNIIDFWKRSRELIFDEDDKTSESLAELYGKLEGIASQREDEILIIEKQIMNKFIKDYTGKEENIDKIFTKYKDIGWLTSRTRDISKSDNLLLDAVWKSVKRQNIDTTDETNEVLDGLDEQIEKVLPILKNIDSKEPFNIFRQRNHKGQLTGHMVGLYSSKYYKDRAKTFKPLYRDGSFANMNKAVSWYKVTTKPIPLSLIFPVNEEYEGAETVQAREDLRKELGEYRYFKYTREQQKAIKNYNKAKEARINNIMSEFDIADRDNISENKEAVKKLNYWIRTNSPYELEKYINDGIIPSGYKNYTTFKNHRYYVEIPVEQSKVDETKESGYYDEAFSQIENNATLLEFYEKITDIFDELEQYLPNDKKRIIAFNGIPHLEKKVFSQYKEEGFKAGFAPIYDAWTRSVQSRYGDVSYGIEDPTTQEKDKELDISVIKDPYKEVLKELNKRKLKYRVENKREPSEALIDDWRDEIVDEISQKKSFDLGRVAKVYASSVLAYKHKSKIEDQLKIAQNLVRSYREIKRDNKGEPTTDSSTGLYMKKSESKSYKNMKDQLDYFMEVFYGRTREEEALGKKIYDSADKATMKELEIFQDKIDEQFKAGDIEEEEHDTLSRLISKQKRELGKRKVWSKVGDNLLKWVQLKGMGWNVLAGIANTGFGFIANTIEGSSNQLYTNRELMEAYKLTFNSMLKNASFNTIELETAKKIRNGMNNWDVLKDISQELFTSSVPSSFNKNTRWLSPYNVNKRTEYLNQAPLLIALTKNTKVETKEGEISIWEGYDSNWQWNTEKYGEIPKEAIDALRIKLDSLIQRNHGNYDPDSPLLAKKTLLGRAVSQFRTWIYEGVAVRLENKRYDSGLGIDVKGRYRSIVSLYQAENTVKATMSVLKGIIRQASFNNVFKDSNFDELIRDGGIEEVDAANLRRLMTELILYININIAMSMLYLLSEDLDDDEPMKYVYNTLINEGLRLRTDIAFYANPTEAKRLVKDLIPAMSIIKDTGNFFKASHKLMIGEDEYETGVYQGDSRFLKSSLTMLPFGTQLYKLYNTGIQTFDK